MLLCACEGVKDDTHFTKKIAEYYKASSRCGCSAKLKISRSKEESWTVAIFDAKHNHDLYAPNEAYLLRSQRNMTEEQRILFNTTCNSDVHLNLEGGEHNLGFTQSKAFNELAHQKRKKKIDSGDVVGLVQHFKNKSNNENNFYWNMEVESDIILINIFFRDSQCFVDYESSGDVLSFDTTYKTNNEGTNTNLKKEIGNATSSLLDCVHGYEKVLSNWHSEEKKKIFIVIILSLHYKISCRTTKGPRQGGRSSQTHGNECPSQQDMFLNSQLGANDQPQWIDPIHFSHGITNFQTCQLSANQASWSPFNSFAVTNLGTHDIGSQFNISLHATGNNPSNDLSQNAQAFSNYFRGPPFN
ncbi:hypothetical protein CDL12_00172 [Handroanthus impetiginosus]|uniref:FAR1 domain-containing protein n=1 Tax=Handroanthus impetiginosus TaxID=429701 RepID=A0A2G9IBF0_9LAMI|nr:hypothetical protein CDL12_00172 [Handroanthus impetiginosus]